MHVLMYLEARWKGKCAYFVIGVSCKVHKNCNAAHLLEGKWLSTCEVWVSFVMGQL